MTNDILYDVMTQKKSQERLNSITEKSLENIWQEIERVRTAHRYSRQAMADILGVSNQKYYSQVVGDVNLSAELLLRFCYVFNYDIKKIALNLKVEDASDTKESDANAND